MEGKIQGRSDPGLNPKGYDQSLGLLKQLKDRSISAIYTSTLQRSIQTARPIAEYLRLPIQKQSELDEIAFGILEGKEFLNFDEEVKIEWEKFKKDRFTYRIPGAENYTDVTLRVKPFAERILRDYEGKEILVVGHRVVNLMLIGLLLNLPLENMSRIEQTNDCIYLIVRNGEAKVFHYMDGQVGEGFCYIRQKGIP